VLWRHVAKRQARGRESVVGGDRTGVIKCYETVAHAPADILRCKLVKITVERKIAGGKGAAVVCGPERLYFKPVSQRLPL
jgi:hypothetical protein